MNNLMKWLGRAAGVGLLALVCVGVLGCANRTGGGGEAGGVGDGVLRVMTYNIHHGEGMDGRLDLDRIGTLILAERADVVALQEVDKGVRRTQGLDLPAELARRTGFQVVFARNIAFQGGEYGNAILSRFPVLSWTNRHYRMLREGEQRGLLEARLKVGRRTVRFYSTHLDFRPDDAERLSNVEELRAVVADGWGNEAVIVCGDFNAMPDSRTYAAARIFLRDAWVDAGSGAGHTYSSTRPERRIDYVFYGGDRRLKAVGARVPVTQASDHLPLRVDFEW